MQNKEATVIVSVSGPTLTAEVTAGPYRFIADEPVAMGGKGSAPDPYSYLLSSLGACMAITMRMYANRKGWSLTGVEVQLAHDHSHAEDCQSCEEDQAFIHQINAQVSLQGELDIPQRQRIFEIGKRCPIHKILSGNIQVAFTLAGM